MSIRVNLEAKKSMQRSTLQRKLPNIHNVIVDSSMVSIYRYKKKRDKTKWRKFWIRENVTGSAFLVEVNTTVEKEKFYFVVLNQEGN